jgi:hypothetical protein
MEVFEEEEVIFPLPLLLPNVRAIPSFRSCTNRGSIARAVVLTLLTLMLSQGIAV